LAFYITDDDLIIKDLNINIILSKKVDIYNKNKSKKSSLIITLFKILELITKSFIIINNIDITTFPY
jgi:ABC-type multidrug transport system fused ATPase/permease subunit